MEQFTTEQAIEFYKSNIWENWNHEQIVRLQLFQELLCVPFNKFHEAMESVLKRPIWTHEFGLNYNGLVMEYLGEQEPPTINEIMNLIPEEKRVIIQI